MEELFKGLLALVGGLWLASLSWLAKRQIGRIDERASKEDLAAVLKRLDEHLRHDEDVQERIFDKLDTLTQWVSELRGALNGLPQKHS